MASGKQTQIVSEFKQQKTLLRAKKFANRVVDA